MALTDFLLTIFDSTFQIPSCKLLCMEKDAPTNDNEPDTMIPLGLAALELLNRLRTRIHIPDLEKEHAPQSNEWAEEIKDAEHRDEQTREYVEHRIRSLREFERRARGE